MIFRTLINNFEYLIRKKYVGLHNKETIVVCFFLKISSTKGKYKYNNCLQSFSSRVQFTSLYSSQIHTKHIFWVDIFYIQIIKEILCKTVLPSKNQPLFWPKIPRKLVIIFEQINEFYYFDNIRVKNRLRFLYDYTAVNTKGFGRPGFKI